MNKNNHHFLLITFATQGQINPTLQLAKRLIDAGAQVTVATTVHGLSKIKTFPSHDRLSYASFSDGFDNGTYPDDNHEYLMSEFKRVGSQTLANLILSLSKDGSPVTFLVYGLVIPWAADVANDMGLPSALLFTQPAAAFAIYHHFFNGHDGVWKHQNDGNEPPSYIKLEGLPLFAKEDLPSFLLPTSPHAFFLPTIREHIETLEKCPNACVLLNSFDALEEEAARNVGNINLITIGPLIPSAYLGRDNTSDTAYGCDLFDTSEDRYIQWLNSKPNCSVVYVSFGSIAVLQKKQMEEIFHGLIGTRRPFLWVVRSFENIEDGLEDMINNMLDKEGGLIVPWCSQMEVLSHQSLGCFVTHCGWNSTMESIVTGMPVVCCPQFSDQMMNAKMVEELWRTGIRVTTDEEGIVKREEIERCVEIVMGGGEEGVEIRRNAQKWKELALEAVRDNGSSELNFRAVMVKTREHL